MDNGVHRLSQPGREFSVGRNLFVSSEPSSMKLSGSPAVPVLILLLALLPASLAAISVFDVIRLSQGQYSDGEIIRLIQTTDSRFVLSAEDTVRLRQAGVTESVIREMLSRPAPQREAGSPASEAAANPSRPPAAGRGSGNDVRSVRRPEPLFAGSPYQERSAEPRAYAAVTLAGIEVLIVRDQAGFSSPLARARAVADTLNSLTSPASGRFAVRAAGGVSKVTFEGSDRAAIDVVTVTPADVAAYRAASRQQVSAGALASFWAALLNDYWAIGVAGKPPRYLVDSREGQALERLSLAVRPPAGPRDAAAVRAALDSLGPADRELLRRLPEAVPEGLHFPVRRSP